MSLFGLIPPAYAQAAGATPAAGTAEMLQQFAPFVLVIGIFYFLLIRPQQQKAKQLRNQLSQLRRGDQVVTAGGIVGTVARVVNDDEVTVEIAEGVRVRVVRSTITGLMSKGEPRTDVPKSDNGDSAPPSPRTARRGKPPAETKS